MSEGPKLNSAAAPPRHRGGRPRLDEGDRRSGRISVPVSQEESDVIERRGRTVHMKKGVFLRHLGLGKQLPRPVPAINYRAYRQLGRLAADFSYVLMLIDSDESVGIDRQLAERILDKLCHVEELLMKGR
jgi:hypothetical protein